MTPGPDNPQPDAATPTPIDTTTPTPEAATPTVVEAATPTAEAAPVAVIVDADATVIAEFMALRKRAIDFTSSGDVAFAEEARGELAMINAVEFLLRSRGVAVEAQAPALPTNLVTTDQLAGAVSQLGDAIKELRAKSDSTDAQTGLLLSRVEAGQKRLDDFVAAVSFRALAQQ